MTRDEIDDFISSVTEDPVIIPDNLDEAFVGLATEEDQVRAVYSIDKCINLLSRDMTVDEATEYFWFNVAGTLGAGFPIYITTPEEESVSPY